MEKTKINGKKKITAMQIFLSISVMGSALFFLYSIIFGCISFRWLCMTNEPQYMFLDYFKHVLFTTDAANLYEKATGVWGCFPPLIYILYFLLYRMTSYFEIIPEHWRDLMLADEALTVFLYYSIFVAVGMLLAIQVWKKKKGDIILFLCLICSTPFFAAFERGNSIMLVFVLLLFVMKFKESNSIVLREMALILIAVSAAIKIYPAIFGFLYLKEGRFKEAFRLFFYGVLLFFGPFVFFGGLKGFSMWLNNVDGTMVVYSIGRIEYIRGLVESISYMFSGGAWTADYLSLVLPNIYLIFMLVMFFLSKDKYRTVFYLCAIMTFYPSNAFRYTLCYLAIPLVMYLMEHGDEQIVSKLLMVEMIGFGLLFTIPTLFGLLTNFSERMFPRNLHLTYVELRIYTAAYFVTTLIIIHELIDIIQHKNVDERLMKRIGGNSA